MSERTTHVIIAGIFSVTAACVSGMFLLLIALLNKPGAGNSQPQPTLASYFSPTTSSPENGQQVETAKREILGLWEYQKSRSPMPSPAESGQVIVAEGDIDNSGTCHIRVFVAGEQVRGLGLGTFKLWLVTGAPEQMEITIADIQRNAATYANTGTCPRL